MEKLSQYGIPKRWLRLTSTRVEKTSEDRISGVDRLGRPPRLWRRLEGLMLALVSHRLTSTRVKKTIASTTPEMGRTADLHASGEDC